MGEKGITFSREFNLLHIEDSANHEEIPVQEEKEEVENKTEFSESSLASLVLADNRLSDMAFQSHLLLAESAFKEVFTPPPEAKLFFYSSIFLSSIP